ncbi:MAG: hypothetical protein KY462_04085 [Actinobacteria bacterium]|nr:hypothetical protein [Actinomycetota bacterium]
MTPPSLHHTLIGMDPQETAGESRIESIPLTQSAARFLRRHSQMIQFYSDMANLAAWADEQERANVKLLALIDEGDAMSSERLESLAKSTRHLEAVKRNRGVILESLISNSVDSFLAYIGQLLGEIFRARPETLRSGQTVRIDQVLEYDDLSELIDWLAEERVVTLTYKGFYDLQADLERALGFTLVPDEDAVREMMYFIEVRNLLVHNLGLINRRFLSRTGADLPLGAPIPIDASLTQRIVKTVGETALSIDARTSMKFGLNRVDVHIAHWSSGPVLVEKGS